MMQVRTASAPVPGRSELENEDHVFQVGQLIGVLDGATVPEGFDTGCVHGPTWYVRQLAARLALGAAARPMATLMGTLAAAILAVRADHGERCDLDHPGTPSAAVCLLRAAGEHLDYLVLCDSPLVVDLGAQVRVISDDRLAASAAWLHRTAEVLVGAVPEDDRAGRLRRAVMLQRQQMNQTHGYWVAAANPDAAYHAVTGTLSLAGADRVRRAALLTDGATRAVEPLGLLDWPGLLDLLAGRGPGELIRRIRAAERGGGPEPRLTKRHDDITAAFCHFEAG